MSLSSRYLNPPGFYINEGKTKELLAYNTEYTFLKSKSNADEERFNEQEGKTLNTKGIYYQAKGCYLSVTQQQKF